MKKSHSRVLAAATALAAGGLAAFALKPAPTPSSQALASRNPAAEVRTQVIRRTIHIKRHQPTVGGGGHGAARLASSVHGSVRSGASGSHAAGSVSGGAVATRASGSSAAGVAASGAPVATRTSGASGAATSGSAVRTRTSGAAGSGGKATTRSSGGGERGDGGGD